MTPDDIKARLHEELMRLRKEFDVEHWSELAACMDIEYHSLMFWVWGTQLPGCFYLSQLARHGLDVTYVLLGERKK